MGIRLITDRPALMPTHVAGLPVVTEPPPPHLPPPPGVIVLRPDGPVPQPTLARCPSGTREVRQYRWRFCNSVADPQPIPTSLLIPPIAGLPYTRVTEIFKRQDFLQLPGVQSVGLEADGIVVQTTEPALIPSTFAGLPVRIEAPQGVFRPARHTLTHSPSILRGGVAIGDHLSDGTLGGFVVSGGEPWLVSAAHNFPAQCGEVPPCPAGVPLHECPQTHARGIPAKLAPKRTSPPPPTVSTLTRWTQLSGTVQADAAAGFIDVHTHPISRRLEGFRRMVTGDSREPMVGDAITLLSAYRASHLLTGRVAKSMLAYGSEGVCNSGGRVVFRDLFGLEMTTTIPDGTSGGLVIDSTGNILGMFQAIGVYDSRLGLAVKAANIKQALQFDRWVGSETVPVAGRVEAFAPPVFRGWAADPLNPRATLPVELYAGGPRGTGKRVGRLTANRSHAGMRGTGPLRGAHGFQSGRIRSEYKRSKFHVYARQPDSSPEQWVELANSPQRPTWPKGEASIEPRGGTDTRGNSQIAIRVKNDTPGGPDSNYPVHPNAKAAVEAVLAAVHEDDTTPPVTSININSTRRVNSTSHSQGRAVDINAINGVKVKCAHVEFRRSDACTGLSDTDIDNMQKWVTALSNAFLRDCRVNQGWGR